MFPRLLVAAGLVCVAIGPARAADPGYPQPCAQLVEHTAFTLCYHEQHEQAAWVQYELTRDEANGDKASRKGWSFEPDQSVETGSATR